MRGCHSEPEPFDYAQDKLRAGEESRVGPAILRFLVALLLGMTLLGITRTDYQILRYAQNDNTGRLHRKVYEGGYGP